MAQWRLENKMKTTQKSLSAHVNNWVGDSLITREQADRILAKYPVDSGSPAMLTFSVVGGLLCILGLILTISANWQSIPREVKLGGLLTLLTASTLTGCEGNRRKWHPAITEISYLFAAVLPLAGLALISQFFNLSGSGFMLVFNWFLSVLFLPFLSLSPSTFVVWLVALFTMVPLGVEEYRWSLFTDRDNTVCVIYAVLGVAITAGSQLWSRANQLVQRAWGESLGLITTSLALLVYDLTTYYPKNHLQPWEILWGIVFMLNLLAVFAGYKFGRRHLVTVGLMMIGVTILSFYLRLAGSMMSTGMLFLTAGTLLLILICAFHKLRKSILQ
jgi:uncharacterized membrane protein